MAGAVVHQSVPERERLDDKFLRDSKFRGRMFIQELSNRVW